LSRAHFTRQVALFLHVPRFTLAYEESEMPWYVISTKPHQEKQAELHIKQWGIECFLPLLKVNKTIRRAHKTVIEPLFPGYLFARFDLNRHYRAVSYATGVRKIVEFGSGPIELDTKMIDAIRERVMDGYVIVPPVRPVKGQIVHIKGGPLAGLEAVFMREMTDRNRVLLLLNTLGFHAKLTVDSDQVAM
jgi:transcriptional antiterminator RfaH